MYVCVCVVFEEDEHVQVLNSFQSKKSSSTILSNFPISIEQQIESFKWIHESCVENGR